MDLTEKAFGGRVDITMADGAVISDALAMANAHPLGAKPFQRPDYIRKFQTLAADSMSDTAQGEFLDAVEAMSERAPIELNPVVDRVDLATGENGKQGIF
jgi:2-methylcitrate dehydratase